MNLRANRSVLAAALLLAAGAAVVLSPVSIAQDRAPGPDQRTQADDRPAIGADLERQRRPISSREVTYEIDGRTYRGYLAMPEALPENETRPGVLVVHEWWGRNDYAMFRADMLAELGFVAFAADMYGSAQVVTSPGRAQNLATPFYTDRSLMVRRAQAGLDQLTGLAAVDADQLAAIGYCFGGTVALELARAGADLDAVVSFHGGLASPNSFKDAGFDGTVMVANGAADEMVPTNERNAFIADAEDAGIDYLFIEHGGAVHSFTNPAADELDMNSVGYDQHADRRSWRHMLLLFEETLTD